MLNLLPNLKIAARITFGTLPSVISSYGAQTITNSHVTCNSTGQSTISFPTPVGVNNYGVLITPRYIQALYCTYGSVGTNSFFY